MKDHWRYTDPDPELVRSFSEFFSIDETMAGLLAARGVTSIHEAHEYLNPRISSLESPFRMKGMYEAVARIRRAVESAETIGIFADSDIDGLTSLAILIRLLEKIGHRVMPPPRRYPAGDDDYGLTREVADGLAAEGVTLLVTLDSGIRDIEEIRYAKSSGMDVIVCDHHEQGGELPDAIIVNPKQKGCPYPFKELAGVGVAFRLCHAVLASYLQRHNRTYLVCAAEGPGVYSTMVRNRIAEETRFHATPGEMAAAGLPPFDEAFVFGSPEEVERIRGLFPGTVVRDLIETERGSRDAAPGAGRGSMDICDSPLAHALALYNAHEYASSSKLAAFLESVTDLVALGTIADIVPLRGENRTLVSAGLEAFSTTTHRGLQVLKNMSWPPGSRDTGKKAPQPLRAKHVAWNIAPLLNTPGRFGQGRLTADFFLETDEARLAAVIADIMKLNEERRVLLTGLCDDFRARVEQGKFLAGESLIFVDEGEIPDGMCGLVASRLADAFGKAVITISGRVRNGLVKGSGRVNGSFNFFERVEPHGALFERLGGHAQAFGFSARPDSLPEIRDRIARSLGGFRESEALRGLHIDAELSLDAVTAKLVRDLALFEPYGHMSEEPLFLTRNVEVDFRSFGGKGTHGKFLFPHNPGIEAVGWGMAERMKEAAGGPIDLVYRLELNEYGGRSNPRMLIVDFDARARP
ncbi:MAG: single-stranded-DNA-specific exonuclease RecJ [Spirochaetes bacterium]|nr:MAG: single-stranded-DNA-specific exonuclease RecJ [Spirochaetota bacterium]